jgi:hypothetical protein
VEEGEQEGEEEVRRKKNVMRVGDLEQLLSFATMDRATLLQSVGADEADIDDGYSYQSMRGLSVLSLPDHFGARVFLDGDAVVMVSVPDPSVDDDDVRSLMGDDVVELRSRQGKRAMIELDAQRGVAFSRDDDEVGFVEMFPPTTVEDYRERIWFDPGDFIK